MSRVVSVCVLDRPTCVVGFHSTCLPIARLVTSVCLSMADLDLSPSAVSPRTSDPVPSRSGPSPSQSPESVTTTPGSRRKSPRLTRAPRRPPVVQVLLRGGPAVRLQVDASGVLQDRTLFSPSNQGPGVGTRECVSGVREVWRRKSLLRKDGDVGPGGELLS